MDYFSIQLGIIISTDVQIFLRGRSTQPPTSSKLHFLKNVPLNFTSSLSMSPENA